MKKSLLLTLGAGFFYLLPAQNIQFQEYDLPNGLHIILHQDNSTPIITTGVMYGVGAKDEDPNRTGFAHFFEHLLFEGTQNIPRGEWDKIVSRHGGSGNANTTNDRTYYYNTFPSNHPKLGLWMESERMRHPVINTIGVETQREVVKEEKRMRMDNQPYGNLFTVIQANTFQNHPYRWSTIGSMDHLNEAKLEEFQTFFKKYYVPNNATLVVAGDFQTEQIKKDIEYYFSDIPKGSDIPRNYGTETPIVQTKKVEAQDPNIQLPAYVYSYRIPGVKERDSYALQLLSSYLSNGKSSVLYKKLVDQQKKALEVGAFNVGMQDYGIFAFFAIPMQGINPQSLQEQIDEEITKVQNALISEEDFQKILNLQEKAFISQNKDIENIAASLATYRVINGDTHLINKELDMYRSITREDIRRVAQEYLKPNQRIEIQYLPEKK